MNEQIVCDRMAESTCNSSVLLLPDLLANRLRISKISAEFTEIDNLNYESLYMLIRLSCLFSQLVFACLQFCPRPVIYMYAGV